MGSRKVLVAFCALAIFAAGLISVGINASEQKKTIRILYSNDLLGYTESCG
jgi:methyl coenzyme M reductase beta subunit